MMNTIIGMGEWMHAFLCSVVGRNAIARECCIFCFFLLCRYSLYKNGFSNWTRIKTSNRFSTKNAQWNECWKISAKIRVSSWTLDTFHSKMICNFLLVGFFVYRLMLLSPCCFDRCCDLHYDGFYRWQFPFVVFILILTISVWWFSNQMFYAAFSWRFVRNERKKEEYSTE